MSNHQDTSRVSHKTLEIEKLESMGSKIQIDELKFQNNEQILILTQSNERMDRQVDDANMTFQSPGQQDDQTGT